VPVLAVVGGEEESAGCIEREDAAAGVELRSDWLFAGQLAKSHNAGCECGEVCGVATGERKILNGCCIESRAVGGFDGGDFGGCSAHGNGLGSRIVLSFGSVLDSSALALFRCAGHGGGRRWWWCRGKGTATVDGIAGERLPVSHFCFGVVGCCAGSYRSHCCWLLSHLNLRGFGCG